MEAILDLYAAPLDEASPVVCFDEQPYQLIGEARAPLPMEAGKPHRYDYTYKRQGHCNLFAFFAPHLGWRHIKVTKQRCKTDYAHCMKDLVDIHFPQAQRTRVIEDNLNTHTPAALYETFAPAEARRLLRKLEFHHTPPHASWLNMVEIELSVLSEQCIGRRLPDQETLRREIAPWQQQRNQQQKTVQWRFTAEKARQKMKSLYPANS